MPDIDVKPDPKGKYLDEEQDKPYFGERLTICMTHRMDFTNAYAVVVSGDGPNVCGHMLGNAGGRLGYYFHVTGAGWEGVYGRPYVLNYVQYHKYMKTSGKREIKRTMVHLPDPDGARFALERLLTRRWFWAVLPHNCAAFVERVFQAGGSKAGLYTNCPRGEHFY